MVVDLCAADVFVGEKWHDACKALSICWVQDYVWAPECVAAIRCGNFCAVSSELGPGHQR